MRLDKATLAALNEITPKILTGMVGENDWFDTFYVEYNINNSKVSKVIHAGLNSLTANGLMESKNNVAGNPIYRFTEAGRAAAEELTSRVSVSDVQPSVGPRDIRRS